MTDRLEALRLPTPDAAAALGVSPQRVRQLRAQHGVPSPHRRPPPSRQVSIRLPLDVAKALDDMRGDTPLATYLRELLIAHARNQA